MRSIQRGALFGAVLSLSALLPASALACGGFFCNQSQPVNQAAESIIFADNGDGTTTAVIQIQYQGPSKSFSWLLPISSVPKADSDIGIASNLVMCINRERSQEEAFDLLQLARPYRDRIAGIGLDCAEEGNPPIKFKEVYAVARAEGYRLTAHCDVNQKNSATHIWQCLEILGCERIDHGMNCLDDPRLVDRLGEPFAPICLPCRGSLRLL